VNKTDNVMMESTKPKHESKSNDIHHLNWTKTLDAVGDGVYQEQHRPEQESKRELACTNKNPLSEPNTSFPKAQVK